LVANDLEGAVLRFDDITPRVHLEEMMLQSAKMASVGGLAAGVAHEINNPLGAIMQSAQMLQIAFDTSRPRTRANLQTLGLDSDKLDRYLREKGLLEYLDGIRTTGARAAKIVSDLLSFSRKTTSDMASHDLNTLIEQTLALAATDYDLKKQYDFRNIEIIRDFMPNLPLVTCDGPQIQQVLLNLLRNAAQAIAERSAEKREEKGQLSLRTSLKSEQNTTAVRLDVEDNGSGIPDSVRARLFEPFFTTKEVGEGSGLGLWLCWSIVVERHKGRIWVESVETGGSRFVVELPAISGQTQN
jgi:signal transduction histidine kinase